VLILAVLLGLRGDGVAVRVARDPFIIMFSIPTASIGVVEGSC
jgi:hypothetical protein